MDALTWFGLFAVGAMLVCYALESRSPWFIVAFAGAARSDRPMAFFRAPGRSASSRLVAVNRWRLRHALPAEP